MKNSFRNLSFQELKVKRDELSKKYMELRFQMVVGHVDNPLQKRMMRRQLARLNTLVREHELQEAGKLNPNAMRPPVRKAEKKA
jgi:large subunit ribosomal protein L29